MSFYDDDNTDCYISVPVSNQTKLDHALDELMRAHPDYFVPTIARMDRADFALSLEGQNALAAAIYDALIPKDPANV